jgi:hypothetical protein
MGTGRAIDGAVDSPLESWGCFTFQDGGKDRLGLVVCHHLLRGVSQTAVHCEAIVPSSVGVWHPNERSINVPKDAFLHHNETLSRIFECESRESICGGTLSQMGRGLTQGTVLPHWYSIVVDNMKVSSDELLRLWNDKSKTDGS